MPDPLQLKPLPEGQAEQPAQPQHPVTALTAKLVASDPDMATLTKFYLTVRDKKKDLDDQAKQAVAPLAAALNALELVMLSKMQALGADSVKTEHGTPYISTRTSVTIADADPYLRFVLRMAFNGLPLQEDSLDKIISHMLNSGALAMIEARPAKSAVESYIESHQDAPPGLNIRKDLTVNVRK